jgi:hypothetical protein
MPGRCEVHAEAAHGTGVPGLSGLMPEPRGVLLVTALGEEVSEVVHRVRVARVGGLAEHLLCLSGPAGPLHQHAKIIECVPRSSGHRPPDDVLGELRLPGLLVSKAKAAQDVRVVAMTDLREQPQRAAAVTALQQRQSRADPCGKVGLRPAPEHPSSRRLTRQLACVQSMTS